MQTSVVLLRGINVGGKNKLPMKDLTAILEELGFEAVQTYIQSGNAVVQSRHKPPAKMSSEIAASIEKAHGFAPSVLILTRKELESAMEANPFPKATKDPKSLHLFLLSKKPKKPDLEKINSTKAASERFELTDRVFYLHAPDGIARSKLAANVEKYLGVPTTARNWNSITKIAALAAGE